MATSNEIVTLAQAASEIDESEVKITFANQCIKAQEALTNKIKNEIQRRKEVCNFKKNENLKLEAEIKNAELELLNMRITHKTLKSANTDLKTEMLLNRERKLQITERIKRGEKKYEDLWTQCQKRYESIPLVQKLTQSKKRREELEINLTDLENEAVNLAAEIKIKKGILAEKDKKQIIELAEFLIHKMPVALKAIEDKKQQLNDLTKEIENIENEKQTKPKATKTLKDNSEMSGKVVNKSTEEWSMDNSLMPKLQLGTIDVDLFNFKLDINKVTTHVSPVKRTVSFTESENSTLKKSKADEKRKDDYISCYFNKPATADEYKNDNDTVNFSKKKLINILEDIQIDENETYKFVAQANIDKFEEVTVITATKTDNETHKNAKVAAPLQSEEIEELDLTNPDDILNPPTQFVDSSQDSFNVGGIKHVDAVLHVNAEINSQANVQLSQTECPQETGKKVSFDLTNVSIQDITDDNVDDEKPEDENLNGTITSEFNLSTATDDNFMAMKDLILKKHHLDLSPQFIYGKNTMLLKEQPKKNEEIVTSKFFNSNNKDSDNNNKEDERYVNEVKEVDEKAEEQMETEEKSPEPENNFVNMDVDNAVSSPNTDKERPVTGILFTHGPQGIPDCLDMSMSTTGYEEGDSDFPTCLDSSLLLSPKPDIPMSDMPLSGNQSEVGSQEIPNFLSGFRKTGLSFFKQQPSENNAASNKNSQDNNFNFNFGSDKKENRGGLFSFFR